LLLDLVPNDAVLRQEPHHVGAFLSRASCADWGPRLDLMRNHSRERV
jgi:hypothetical protein